MCVVISSKENDKTFAETGVDPWCEEVFGDIEDFDYVKKLRKGKIISN